MRGIRILQSRTQSHRSSGAGLAFHWEFRTYPGSSTCLGHEEGLAEAQLGIPLNHAGKGRRNSKRRWLWRPLGEPGSPGDLERLPWRTWRRLLWTRPCKIILALPFYSPDNWNPHTDFGNEAKTPATGISHGHRENHPQRNSPPATLRKRYRAVQMQRPTHLVVHLLRKRHSQTSGQAHQVSNANEGEEKIMHSGHFPLPLFKENGRTSLHSQPGVPRTNLRNAKHGG
jgi:hypothetical protein